MNGYESSDMGPPKGMVQLEEDNEALRILVEKMRKREWIAITVVALVSVWGIACWLALHAYCSGG